MDPRPPLVLSLCLGLSLLFCLRGLLARLLLGCLLGFLLLASAPKHRLLHRWLHPFPISGNGADGGTSSRTFGRSLHSPSLGSLFPGLLCGLLLGSLLLLGA